MQISDKLLNMMKRGSDLLGSDYSIICGAMTWISDPTLVSAVSNAGAFGVLAGGAMNCEDLSSSISKTKQLTAENFGANLILAHPMINELVDVCGEHKVSHVIFAGGVPDKQLVQKVHDYGIKCIGFAPTLPIAKRLFKNGIDGLIIEGSEAGGHIGSVSTLVLVQEILLELRENPIFVAGGIVRGEILASMLLLGASGCQMGSIFACCKESTAHEKFKRAFFSANSRDAVVSTQLDKAFPVTAVRAIENNAYREFMKRQKEALFKLESGQHTLEEARLSLEHFWAGALRRAAVDGDVETGSIMAGQSVGLIKEEQSVSEVLSKLMTEASVFLDKCEH